MVKAPGVVTGRYGTIGEVFLQEIDFWPLNTTLWVSDFHGNDERFVYYLLQRVNFGTHSGKSGVPGVNRNDLHTEVVSLPTCTDEQRQIAAALEDCDRLIAALERLVAKKEAIKTGLMQQLLTGQTRLPGFVRPWHPRCLGDMLSYEQPWRYLVQTATQLPAGRVPVLTAGKTFILGYTNETYGVHKAHPVIIFDDFTTAAKYVDFDFKAKSSAMKMLTPKPGVDLRFVYERMQLIDFPLGDHKRYWISEYSRQALLVPEQEEQAAIASVLNDADRQIDALRERLRKAREIKLGMMQQLLTGRTRLPVAEAVA
jgi:type I restriction enzyme S subunit